MPNDGFPYNPAAFPRPKGWNGLTHADEHSHNDDQAGMSLRDYFAGQALAGMPASFSGTDVRLPPPHWAAATAHDYANAMLAAREQQKGGK